MLEHAIYSVISPEGAASILWHDSSKAKEAATNMKITAQDLLQLGIIDSIIAEPVGGAHRDPETAVQSVGEALELALLEFDSIDGAAIRKLRRDKFVRISGNRCPFTANIPSPDCRRTSRESNPVTRNISQFKVIVWFKPRNSQCERRTANCTGNWGDAPLAHRNSSWQFNFGPNKAAKVLL